MPTRRARRDQMLKRERERLARKVTEYVLSVGGRVAETGRVVVEGGRRVRTNDRLELTTRAGTLSVIPYDDWIACRFHDVKAAVALLGYDPACGRLNPFSGKWNFHFGRRTAEDALTEFADELGRVLPKGPPAIQAGSQFVGWLDSQGYRSRRRLAGDALSLSKGEFFSEEFEVPADADREAAWREFAPLVRYGYGMAFEGDTLRLAHVGAGLVK